MLRPSARCSVPDSSNRNRALSSSGSQRPAPARGGVGYGGIGERVRRHVGQRGQMMHLVDHEQRAMPPKLGEMQVGCGGDTLIGDNVSPAIRGKGQARCRQRGA